MLEIERMRTTWVLSGLVSTCLVFMTLIFRLIALCRRMKCFCSFLRDCSSGGRGSVSHLSPAARYGSISADGTEVGQFHPHKRRTDSFEDDDIIEYERVLPFRMLFHVLVFLYILVELPIFIICYLVETNRLPYSWEEGNLDTSYFYIGRVLYSLHIFGYLLLFSAFCVILSLWSGVALREPNVVNLKFISYVLQFMCAVYSITTALEIIRCFQTSALSSVFFQSRVFRLFCLFSVVELLFLAVCFLVLGCMVQHRVWVALGGGCGLCGDAEEGLRGGRTVLRVNAVVLTCVACFLTRAFMLLDLFQMEKNGDEAFFWVAWRQEVYLEWLPQLLPCVALLLLMRKDAPCSSIKTDEEDH